MNNALRAALRLVWWLALIGCSGASDRLDLFGRAAGDGGGTATTDGASSTANLVASPTTESFGTVLVGQQGAAVRIEVSNTGRGPSGALLVAVGGADASSFPIDSDACKGQVLAAGAQCVVAMHFAPASAGGLTATLNVTDALGDSAVIALTGTATMPPDVSLLPAKQDFGTVVVSATSAPTTFTLANTGTTDVGTVQMTVDGPDANQFSVAMDVCSGKPLAAGTRCSLTVAFGPTSSGTKTATLTATIAGGPTFTSSLGGNAAGGAAFVVTLTSGIATPTTSYDFGQVTIGTTPAATQGFTVTNSGGVTSGVPMVAVSGSNASDFALASNGCTSALPANGNCSFSIAFSPSVAATESATVAVTAPATTSASLALDGEGLAPAALKPTPTTHTFGTVVQGATSAAQTFTITNTGTATSGPLTVSLSGTSQAQFTLGSNTCTNQQLLGNATCTVAVTFSPNSAASGTVHAELLVTGNPGGTASASLTGTASTLATLSIGPTPYDFGNVAQGVETTPVTFTVSNSGSLASGTPTVTEGGANKADFKIVANNCAGYAVPGNGTCTISVAFQPSTQAPESATITVGASPGGAVTATLSGAGAAQALLQVTPSPSDYGPIVQGMQSATKRFTVSNMGGVVSGALAVSMAGTNEADFVIATNTCTGKTLAANGASVCTIGVAFKPSTTTPESGTLTVVANPGGTATSSLMGTGVTQGTLTVTPPAGAFNGVNKGTTPPPTITFQVSNTGGTASGVPAVTVSGTNASDFKVTASTCTAAIPANTMNACQVVVAFAPSTLNVGESATLNIAANPGGTTVLLSGTGTAPSITITPTTQSFAALPGQTQSFPFTVKNGGTGATRALSVSTPASPFVVLGSNGCSGTMLAAGSECTFSVEYAPPATEMLGATDKATVVVMDPYSATDTASATLTGTAEAAGVNLVMTSSPTPAVYSDSGSVTFTVTNWGAVASGKLSKPTFSATETTSGDLDADLAIASDSCTGVALIAAASCTYDLVFTAPASPPDGGTATFSGTTGVSDGTSSATDMFSGSYDD